MKKTCILKIFRGTTGNQYWEEFEVERNSSTNVISALMEIRKNPKNVKGEYVEPVVWEDGCLEEVCGSCSMLINGTPKQACVAIVNDLIEKSGSETITLAPLSKFPLIRDLMVDRSVMFENLKKIHGWVEVDRSTGEGCGPKISQKKQDVMYSISQCMTCGCCSEACPQVNEKTQFMGPSPIAQARFFNAHPTGKTQKKEREDAIMSETGIKHCGSSHNCVKVCPKKLPLTESLSGINRNTNIRIVKDLFSLKEDDD